MKTIYNIWRLSLVCITMLAGVLISCDKDEDDKVSGQVQLLSFGPSGVLHGEDIVFIGSSLDKVTSIVLPPSIEVPSSSFKEHTRDRIVLTVPFETMEGKVVLNTPQGQIESKTNFGLNYTMAITSLPTKAKPGTNMTINGEFLNYVKEVQFAEGKVVTEFVSQSRTELVVTVPLDASTGKIALSDGKVDPQLVRSEQDLQITLPAVTSLSPASIKHGDNLTISGTDLDLVTEITFTKGTTGSKVTTFVSKAPESIVVTVPDDAQTGKLTLKVHSGLTVQTTGQVSIILPVATAISPFSGVAGDDITITGTNLDLVKEVIFPSASAVSTFHSQTATSIVLDLPSNVGSGGVEFVTKRNYRAQSGVAFGADPSPLLLVFFDDAFKFGYGDWSWGTGRVSVPVSTDKFKTGTSSWKMTFPLADAGLSWGGGTAVSTVGYTKFSFSVFGGPGTNGKHLDVVLNDTWSGFPTVTIVEGQWTEFDIPFSSFAASSNVTTQITRIILRSPSGEEGTMWIDKVGFK